ncbi:5-formyltetrahydrofolate cyclo-ligase [Rhodopseudomonas palustris]|uniref:5-formyltetrahydrofolate cyclo-ligase n=1 Tax=Rhodopseudomonas palustris TaxID=1076 RepID=UPI002ACE46FF|nr:5-formyltetrahydrofolate cyclo-ligase [Rhodopseudomonas palustris]WQG99375.1 5-formyltetrahydrofolate cyclo-ligase [Rhodopseudomonas palustris]
MTDLSDSPSKDELRVAALARRLALSNEARTAAAAAIAARELPFAVPTGAIVAGYVPIRGEIDPFPLMRALLRRGAKLALPVVTGQGRPLTFCAWSEGDVLQRSELGILEPPPGAPEVAPDIVLAPLAAFDALGHRIGYGAGHYDRTLAALRRAKPVVAAGLAFAVQQIEAVPAAAHDVALDYVITEQGTLIFRSR